MKARAHALLVAATLVSTLSYACGGDRSLPVQAKLEAPSTRDARISIRPGLDVSALADGALAERIVIDAIDLHIADVRLLGPDPRIPAGGLALLGAGKTLSIGGSSEDALEIPIAEHLLEQDSLSVYVRIDRTDDLSRASVLVRGRLYAQAGTHPAKGLSATTDPDGAPAEKGVSRQGIDPDGDPADCAPDPDGDPAHPTCTSANALIERARGGEESIPFELRGEDVEDLVASLSAGSRLDVVVGIPAARWFTPEVVDALERSFAPAPGPATTTDPARTASRERPPTVVLEPKSDRAQVRLGAPASENEYYVAESPEELGWLKIRHP